MNYRRTKSRLHMPFDPEKAIAEREEIIGRVTAMHKDMPGVKGMFLSGTLAGRPRDQFSDLDFIMVCSGQLPSAEQLEDMRAILKVEADAIHTAYDVSSEYGVSSAFDVEGIETCFIYYDADKLSQYIGSYYAGDFRKVGAFYPGATVAAIAENPILFEYDGVLSALKSKATDFSPQTAKAMCEQELGWFDYYLEKLDQYGFRRDPNGKQLTLSHAVDSVLNIVFAINAIPYAGPGKPFEAKLNRLHLKPDDLADRAAIILTGYSKQGEVYRFSERESHLKNLLAETRDLVAQAFPQPSIPARVANYSACHKPEAI